MTDDAPASSSRPVTPRAAAPSVAPAAPPSLYVHVVRRASVKLHPDQLHAGYRDEILMYLRRQEGMCTRHGYVRPRSIELHRVRGAQVDANGLRGDVVFDVSFYAVVCNPPDGAVLRGVVQSANSYGLCVAAADGVLQIIVPRQGDSVRSEVDLDGVREGDGVLVRVLRKQQRYADRHIIGIGCLVAGAPPDDDAALLDDAGGSLWASDDEPRPHEGADSDEEDVDDGSDDDDSSGGEDKGSGEDGGSDGTLSAADPADDAERDGFAEDD
jgi:DNA-directed RNA polymerase subunit E'/Rpb7